jgi:hypothetical protein
MPPRAVTLKHTKKIRSQEHPNSMKSNLAIFVHSTPRPWAKCLTRQVTTAFDQYETEKFLKIAHTYED